jgi:coproporphyrinogen III oxidase
MPPYVPMTETREDVLPGLSSLPALPLPAPSSSRGSPSPTRIREPMEDVPLRLRVSRWMQFLHDNLTQFFEDRDGAGRFQEDAWLRPGGGGGVSRVLTEGATFEKAGVNRFAGGGPIPAELAARLGSSRFLTGTVEFFATGVSVVCHPRSPLIPIVHMNVRYFELRDGSGRRVDHWFGGGLDLTPTYPFPEDAVHFHQTLRRICNRHHPDYYRRFKSWCDDYFVNTHRDEERRGVGGIFFDNVRSEDPDELETEALFRFVQDVGLALRPAYGTLVERRRHLPWGAREKDFQLVRRGRYAEFNLVHDRGTRFGLQTNARIESVLMSMPPMARWGYALSYEEDTFEHRLMAMLEPRDWTLGVPESLATPVR